MIHLYRSAKCLEASSQLPIMFASPPVNLSGSHFNPKEQFMNSIYLKKGYRLNLTGKPSLDVAKLSRPARVAILPQRFRYVKPRLRVAMGDAVKVGSVLVEDKRHPELTFCSPGGGKISEINYGQRRVIQEIVVELDNDEQFESFERVAEEDLETIDRDRLVSILLEAGLWSLIRELPFRDIAATDVTPPAIFVNLDNLEPFQPHPEVYLNGQEDLFAFGLKALNRLAADRVKVTAHQNNTKILGRLGGAMTYACKGNYPAHDPGVLLYRTKADAKENHAWFIDGQDLLLLARLLKTGRYPTERVVVLSGSNVKKPQHFKTRLGVPLAHIVQNAAEGADVRYIAGGILTGYTTDKNSYLGFHEKSIMLMPEGRDQGPFLDWVMPGFKKTSYSRAFLSYFNRSELQMNCNRHGGLRACIACNHCPEVCPVDILPQLALKSVLAGEVEESLTHGLLDCVECGLCSYVCPSKIEVAQILRKAKEDFYKEMSS